MDTFHDCIQQVADYYGLPVSAITHPTRRSVSSESEARKVAAYLLINHMGCTPSRTSRLLGYRSASPIMTWVKAGWPGLDQESVLKPNEVSDSLLVATITQHIINGEKRPEFASHGHIRARREYLYEPEVSGYKGVYFDRRWGKWQVTKHHKNKRYRLGTYRIYDDAVNVARIFDRGKSIL